MICFVIALCKVIDNLRYFLTIFTCRLLHDRELSLYDGTRLLRWDRYQAVKQELQLSDEELQQRFVSSN